MYFCTIIRFYLKYFPHSLEDLEEQKKNICKNFFGLAGKYDGSFFIIIIFFGNVIFFRGDSQIFKIVDLYLYLFISALILTKTAS